MDVRLLIAVASDDVNVSEFCRRHRVSRQSFYKWRRAFRLYGLEGLEPRSRAPLHSPGRVSTEVEEAIVALRKELADLGVDHGPGTIQWHLSQRREVTVPSQATIWRVLVRRGFVIPEPRKRPKNAWQRFQADAPNELWQADAIGWVIATGPVSILSFIDDCTRCALRVAAVQAATTEATWAAFSDACATWGLPLGQLTDNGLNFSGKLRGFEVMFEVKLRAAGVVPKTSRAFHPQTCGKVERFQQTLKKWLRRQPLARDLTELQAQLDRFVDYYNHHRPHRALDRRTPAAAWAATPPAINLGIAIPGPTTATTATVDNRGVAVVRPWRIHVGARYKGLVVQVRHDDTHAAVFHGHHLIRALQLDTTRSYQPAAKTPRPLP